MIVEYNMKKETVTTAPTVEAAVAAACAELGVSKEAVAIEVLTEPKRGFLGMGAVAAKVKVIYTESPVEAATAFIKQLLADMQIEAEVAVGKNDEGDCKIEITGAETGVLIGHHGETLDSLQYLCNLAANKKDSEDDDREYTRIALDIGGYRAKREETLRALARRTAERAKKYKRSVSLEPMPAHERRIIHSEVQKIDGVTTSSVGSDSNRKVVIYPAKRPPKDEE